MEFQPIQTKIYEMRGRRVMLDFDLAALYQVETRTLKQAVRRNIDRFPDDFLLKLPPGETNELIINGRSQIVISPGYNVGSASEVFAFTELGVSMLSSVLRSERAIQMNIAIMRAFVSIRQMVMTSAEIRQLSVENAEIRAKLELLERDNEDTLEAVNDLSEDVRRDIDNLYNAIGELSVKPTQLSKPRNPIGFKPPGKE